MAAEEDDPATRFRQGLAGYGTLVALLGAVIASVNAPRGFTLIDRAFVGLIFFVLASLFAHALAYLVTAMLYGWFFPAVDRHTQAELDALLPKNKDSR